MTAFSRLATALLLCGAGWACAAPVCTLEGRPADPANAASLAGKSGMLRCVERAGGALVREQQVQGGALLGKVRLFEQGRLRQEFQLNAKGSMDGPAREFAPDGQLLRDSTYDDGSEVGLMRSYHPNGRLRRVAFRDNPGGERAMAEFTPDGKLSALRCSDKPLLAPIFDDATLCGLRGRPMRAELFDDKGILRSRVTHLAGKRVQTESLYDNGLPATQEEISGQTRTERRFSSSGTKRHERRELLGPRGTVPQYEQSFSESGTLVREQRWDAAGEPTIDNSYDLDGHPRSKTTYSGSGLRRVADVTEFHPNGKPAAQGRFLAPTRAPRVPIGVHKRHDPQGALISESTYDAGGRITRERSWDADGLLLGDEAVQADGSRKPYAQ